MLQLEEAYATTHGIHGSKCRSITRIACKEVDAEAFKGLKIVFGGTLDGQQALDEVKPAGELWVKYRASWLTALEGAGQMQGFE